MREPHRSDKSLHFILSDSSEATDGGLTIHMRNDQAFDSHFMPVWLHEQITMLFNAAAAEPIPVSLVRLLRQLNEVEDR
jgi:hypothetical protein